MARNKSDWVRRSGNGRRESDLDITEHCLKCDVRADMKQKVSWAVFIWVIGGILAIGATIAAISAPIIAGGAKSMVETSKNTLKVVHRIEINQAVLASKVGVELAEEDYDDH